MDHPLWEVWVALQWEVVREDSHMAVSIEGNDNLFSCLNVIFDN